MPDQSFVNPYNFVPFAGEVIRHRAWGHVGPAHAREGDWFARDGIDEPLYSGSVEMRWTLKTPLQIPPEAAGEWLDGNTVRIPGSSIKGVTRSVHEAMFKGCARVFDDTFVPVHRMPAVTWPPDQADQWRLVQVVGAVAGRPTRLRLTEDLTFVKAQELAELITQPTTGDVVDLDLSAAEEVFRKGSSRWELVPTAARLVANRVEAVRKIGVGTPVDGCVFVVTDTKPRNTRTGYHPAHWATGRLTGEHHDITASDKPALDRFVKSAKGADDRRRAEHGEHAGWQTQPQFVTVRQGRAPLGRRVVQTGNLFVGDVLWVRMVDSSEGARIEEFLLSQIWRRTGSGTAGERAPHILPCQPDHEGGQLCLSCATFGSIDAMPKSRSDGQAAGYRGHIRFSSAVANEVSLRAPISRAPLSSPRPGSGGFYLQDLQPGNSRSQGDVITHWGSDADPSSRSALRGRKFYWHSDPEAQYAHWAGEGVLSAKQRYRAAQGQPLPVAGVRLVNAPTTFTGTVTFDRLPALAVQALLAALSPQRVADALTSQRGRRLAVHLGGGKPFGLGSAIPHIDAVQISTVTHRYANGPVSPDPTLMPAALKQLNDEVGGLPLGEVLRLLDLDGLSDTERLRVSYPPGADWSQFGTSAFARSYDFFGKRNGEQLETRTKPFTPLPRANRPQRIDWDGQ